MSRELPSKIGRYDVVQALGRGGMGTVLLARDPRLDRTLAIKVLSVDTDTDELRERFAREARSAAGLRHPNIVTIYDIGEDDGRTYIAMEYVDGESLAEVIRRRAPFSVLRRLELVQDLCTGLAYAHKGGVIHRDIKPANLMLSAEGVLKILDFGLARLRDSAYAGLTHLGMMGTPQYMSPEQIGARQVDQRSDIFSAGLVMYELLTYRKAFDADNPIAVLQQIVTTDAPPLGGRIADVDADVDQDLERIVATALQREPERRYQHADLMLRDLERVTARLKFDADPGGRLLAGGVEADLEGVRPPSSRSPADREALLRRRASQIRLHLDRAQTHFDAGDYDAAIEASENALLLDPTDARAVALIDRVHEAVEQRQVESWLAAARDELSRGNPDAAASLVDQALHLRPGLQDALDFKRVLEQRAADVRRSVEREAALRRALERARSAVAGGAFEAASRAVGEALAFDPEHPAALALKQEIAAKLSTPRPPLPNEDQAPAAGELTIVVAAPAAGVKPPSVHEGTMFIPAGAAGAGPSTARPGVRLIVLQAGDANLANASFEVTESFEIGREARDLRSSDLAWSRRHALIEYGDRGYTIKDLGSSGGTYVNGRRVRPDVAEPLFYGARITIGSSVLTFSPSSDTRLPDLTGAEVAGRYILERLLRTSSKGAVYLARQKAVRLRHALKLLSPSLLIYPGYLQRFKREAEVATELHHPHICDVQDYGEATLSTAGGPPIATVYLCLRLMSGGNLADRLDARQPIPPADIARWIERLGDALGYAHRRGVVHGDLKPSAIVFDSEGANAYLTDFAIGQPREGDSSPGVIGTPAYMAPEQWDGAPATPATDQFGLAALAYYMIAGVRPFEGQDHPEIRRRNFDGGPPPAHKEALQHGRDGVRPSASRVLARGLAYNAEDRYPDVVTFAQHLGGALTGSLSDRDPAASPRVFLSYHRAGGAGLPLFLVSRLREKHGIEVFIDVHRVDGAVKFPERLVGEMRKADVFVCLLGPATLESHWVKHEIHLASEQRKPMIPVFHENYVLPASAGLPEVDELLSFDGIRLMDQQNLYVEEGIDKLARRIKDTLAHDRAGNPVESL